MEGLPELRQSRGAGLDLAHPFSSSSAALQWDNRSLACLARGKEYQNRANPVAIPCPQCGRQYDITLFQFGRTIHCTCGRRVGLEKRLGPPDSVDQPRFIADAMLGRVARWLRTLGYDTDYDQEITDSELVRRAISEGRHILTRDRSLPEEWRIDGYLVLSAEDTLEQLSEVVSAFKLRPPSRLFDRCRMCNEMLEPVSREEVASAIPKRVLEREAEFRRCPGCERTYWEGSHTARMRAVLGRIF